MDSALLYEYCNRLQGSQCKQFETENKLRMAIHKRVNLRAPFFSYVHMVDFCKKKLARTKYLFDLTIATLCAQGNVSTTGYNLVAKLLDENCQHSAKFNEQSCTTMDDSIQ